MSGLSKNQRRKLNNKACNNLPETCEQLMSAWQGDLLKGVEGVAALEARLVRLRTSFCAKDGNVAFTGFCSQLLRLVETTHRSTDFSFDLMRTVARITTDRSIHGIQAVNTFGPSRKESIIVRCFSEMPVPRGAKPPRGLTHLAPPRTAAARRAEAAVGVLR